MEIDPVRLLALYAHPLLGVVTVLLVARVASLGLRARRPSLQAPRCRARHRRLAPLVYLLVLGNWAGGLAAVWWLADEALELAVSGHFAVGSAIVGLLTAGAILSRWVPVDPRARALHPWLGATAALLGGVQVFLGLEILRR
jgi:hypothetical protein